MSVSTTSKEAYKSIGPKLGDKQRLVYETIKSLGRATNEMVADHLGYTINRVTGRVAELREFGLVVVDGIARSKSGRSAKVWVACDLNDKKLKQMSIEDLLGEQDCEG